MIGVYFEIGGRFISLGRQRVGFPEHVIERIGLKAAQNRLLHAVVEFLYRR